MAPIIDQYPVFEKGSHSAQYQQISNYCVNYLEGLLVNLMYTELPENLRYEAETYPHIQQQLLKRERTVRHAFQFQIEKLFSDFKSIRRTRLHANRSSDWLSFGLAGHNSSKVQQIIEKLSDKYQKQYERQLLNQLKRLKILVHRTDETLDDNPLSPNNLCNAFLASIEALNLTTNKTFQLFELFDSILDKQLQNFYIQIDMGLYHLDILPELTDPALFEEPAAEDDFSCLSDDPTIEQESEEQDLILLINQQLKTRKKLLNKKTQAHQLVIHHIQTFKMATQSGTFEYASEFETLGQNISDLMNSNQCAEINKFAQFYTRLLNNPLLKTPLKLELSRLCYPLLELVLVDPFFFRSSSHPVNDFIHSIIDFEIRYQHQDNSLSTLHSLLDQLLAIEKPALSDFQSVIQVYEDFKQAEIEHIDRQREQQKIADETLKKNVLQQVNGITDSIKVNNETLSFFIDDWQLLLVQLARKIGIDSSVFGQAIEIARMLAWSLNEHKDKSNKKYKKQSFTQVLKAIDKGLNAVDFSSEHRHRTRKQLVKNFKQHNKKSSNSKSNTSALDSSGTISQFSTTIISKRAQLTDLTVRSSVSLSDSETSVSAQDLNIGSWVEIQLENSRQFKRAKLKWKSPDNNQFLFIDQRGHKLKDSNRNELNEELAKGTIKILHATLPGKSKSSLGSGFHCFTS